MPSWISTLISDLLDYNALVLLVSTLPIGVHTHQLARYNIIVVYIYTVAVPYKAENL